VIKGAADAGDQDAGVETDDAGEWNVAREETDTGEWDTGEEIDVGQVSGTLEKRLM